jgi:hypothetical protein
VEITRAANVVNIANPALFFFLAVVTFIIILG